MSELPIGPDLVNRKVCHPARPEWGEGTVASVRATTVNGQSVYELLVDFAVGRRKLLAPPARLIAPLAAPPQETGWLDTLARQTPDDELRNLPESVTQVLGAPRDRLAALAPLYEYADEPAALLKWARRQTQMADPLSRWSRDELQTAFQEFCRQRDALARQLAATLRRAEGPDALNELFAEMPPAARERLMATLV